MDEGWVCIAKILAPPATSRRVPRLEVGETPVMVAVPLRVRLPLAKGVPAVGRTRTFCQVSLQVTPLRLALVTVKTSCGVVTEVIETAVPLATPLILALLLAVPVSRVMSIVGNVAAVSKTKPAGALRMMVPVPTLPLAFSEYVGPVKLVKVLVILLSAEMLAPPVAAVYWGGLTATVGLVLGVLLPSVRSLAVSVKFPLVLKVTVRFVVPEVIALADGRVAVASLELSATMSLTVLTRFHWASTALTVTTMELPTVCP